MRCEACGHQNPEGSNFCANCGEPLGVGAVIVPGESTRVITGIQDVINEELSEAELAAIESLPPGSALLIVQRGPNLGARYLLDAPEVTAGRSPSCDVFLDDVTVSRHHARFVRKDGITHVTDLGSLNGTYVNRELLDHEVGLKRGDEVQIGKFRLVFFDSGVKG
jgi:pSer/pThr/pTyr-binding forkhead associated (FHA) protein